MNENISWVLVTKIKDGELENLKTLMKDMIESANSNEPGTTRFEGFISEDQQYFHIFEHYKDSASGVIHMKSFGKDFAKRFMAILDVKSFIVYGTPSDELKSIMDRLGVKYMSLLSV